MAEELDFAGLWKVFTVSTKLLQGTGAVTLIAESRDPVRCNKGMRVLPDHTLEDHPDLDVLLVPGGNGTRSEVPGRDHARAVRRYIQYEPAPPYLADE